MFPFGRHDNQLHLFQKLKGVVGMLRDPEHTESVFDIEDGLRDVAATEAMVAHLRRQPAVGAAFRGELQVDLDAAEAPGLRFGP